jgi:SET domain-containing protein
MEENKNEKIKKIRNSPNLKGCKLERKSRSKSKKKIQIKNLKDKNRFIKLNKTTLDLSNGLEEIEIIFPKIHLNKLLRSNYDYKTNYVMKSEIKSGNIEDYNLTKDYKCLCDKECTKESCSCIMDHVQKYECNNNCPCVWDCGNRVVQKGLNHRLKVDYINNKKGFGVFSLEHIKKNEFICEYVGVILSKDSANDKIQLNKIKKKNNYVLQIRENYETMTVNTYIDAEEKGNVSRFLNHSCNSNLFFDIIRIDSFIPVVAFFAKRDIQEGEELTFSYGEKNNEEEYDLSSKECLCGEIKCMKFLPS